jgi:hypothetical protein
MATKARSEELLIDTVGDELVVYDTREHAMHRLNPTAAAVWRLCDGRRTAPEIAALLSVDRPAPVDEDAVVLALEELEAAGLLEEVEASDAEPVISRRSALKKIGVAGGIVLGLPLVESVLAPTPALAWGRGSSGSPSFSPNYDHQDFQGPKSYKNNNNSGNQDNGNNGSNGNN